VRLVRGDPVGVGLDPADRAARTLPSTIDFTFASAVPVSTFSSPRWWPHGFCAVAPEGAAGAAAVVVAALEPDAAEAMP
jgi:hypothetical protein